MESAGDLAMCMDDYNGHVGRHIDGFDGVHGGYGVGKKNLEGRMLLQLSLNKELYVSTTWSKREAKWMVIFKIGENETKIDFVLIKKEH